MKFNSLWLLALLGAAPAFGAPVDAPAPVVTYPPTSAAATITLGEARIEIISIPTSPEFPSLVPLQPRPFTFTHGTHLQIVVPVTGINGPVVTWYKDGKPLTQTATMLDIASASGADSGNYTAMVRDSAGVQKSYDSANVVINETGPMLVNYSTRARLSAAQPSFVGGFVIQPGPTGGLVLIRAVGPALAPFGVTDPLAAPKLRVLDSSGREVTQWNNGSIVFLSPSGTEIPSAGAQVGAFPLPLGSKDVERTFLLQPGAYTAEVSSADGGSGTVLLEIYQLPI
jgi:hypothetical protein